MMIKSIHTNTFFGLPIGFWHLAIPLDQSMSIRLFPTAKSKPVTLRHTLQKIFWYTTLHTSGF